MELGLKSAAALFAALAGMLAVSLTAPAVAADAPKNPVKRYAGDFGPPQGMPIKAQLTSPPFVPAPITRRYPAKVIVELEVVEKEMQISEGVKYTFWTFGGTVPGSFIRIRQGDTVEFHLKNNPSSKMPHNIDLHGVTGPGGGAASSFTAPGHESQFHLQGAERRAVRLSLRHRAGRHAHRERHVRPDPGRTAQRPGQGRSRVLRHAGRLLHHRQIPRERPAALRHGEGHRRAPHLCGLQRRGRLAHRRQGAQGQHPREGSPLRWQRRTEPGIEFPRDRRHLRQGALRGRHPGPGERADHLDSGGRRGGGRIHHQGPRQLSLVDHSIFRALQQGGAGDHEGGRTGGQVDLLRQGARFRLSRRPRPAEHGRRHGRGPGRRHRPAELEDQVKAGQALFLGTCSVCHQGKGEGIPGVFPPLAGSDFLNADHKRALGIVLHGLAGKVTVNGKEYDSVMPPMNQLNDDEVANILTYALNSWGNKGRPRDGGRSEGRTRESGAGRQRGPLMVRAAAGSLEMRGLLMAMMLLAAPGAASAADYVAVPGGTLASVLATPADNGPTRIAPFLLRATPVTKRRVRSLLVRAHPEWQRGAAPSAFVDGQYLHAWESPIRPGASLAPNAPVTAVSWFAAQAFCESEGGRLPTWAEWEYVAAADATHADARTRPEWRAQILSWYAQSSAGALPAVGGPLNFYGVRDIHGLVWEWVDDFNALLVSADSRNQGDPDKLQFCGAGAISLQEKENYAILMRIALLSSLSASGTTDNLGFRCARSAPGESK